MSRSSYGSSATSADETNTSDSSVSSRVHSTFGVFGVKTDPKRGNLPGGPVSPASGIASSVSSGGNPYADADKPADNDNNNNGTNNGTPINNPTPRRRRGFSMPRLRCPSCGISAPSFDLPFGDVLESGLPTYVCALLGVLFFCASFWIFIGAIVPTMSRQNWELTRCTVEDAYYYSVESCDDDGCSTSYHCDITVNYGINENFDPNALVTAVEEDPWILEVDEDGEDVARNPSADEVCAYYEGYQYSEQTLRCWYDPDDSGDIVMTIHHVPRLVRSVIVMAILCCLCCCFAAVTAPFVD